MEEERGGGREMAAEKEKAWNEEEEAFRDKRGKRPSFPSSAYTTAAAPLPQQSHSLIGAARQPSQAGPLKNGWGGERWAYCSRGW